MRLSEFRIHNPVQIEFCQQYNPVLYILHKKSPQEHELVRMAVKNSLIFGDRKDSRRGFDSKNQHKSHSDMRSQCIFRLPKLVPNCISFQILQQQKGKEMS